MQHEIKKCYIKTWGFVSQVHGTLTSSRRKKVKEECVSVGDISIPLQSTSSQATVGNAWQKLFHSSWNAAVCRWVEVGDPDILHGQGIFWQTVCQLRLAIGKANCGAPQLPTRDG